MYNYSVIIPHRNSVSKLKRAVASIPKREDIEVIVIDNSTVKVDLSFLENLSHHKLLYSDITKGAGHARNIGLDASCAKWILFLDADDFFTKNAFSSFDNFINSEHEIIYFNSTSLIEGTKIESDRHIYYSKLVTEFIESRKRTDDSLRYRFYSPCLKLVNYDLIDRKNIRFDEVPASNDLMFSLKVGHFAKSVDADSSVVYCITLSQGSLTTSLSKINFKSRFKVAINQYKFMKAINRSDLKPFLMSRYLNSLNYGFLTFSWCTKLIIKNRINIFLSFKPLFK